MSKETTGRGSRTPFKHSLLNSILGREAGVIGNHLNKTPVRLPYVVIDANAGDGVPGAHTEKCSPEIIIKHVDYIRSRLGVDTAKAILIEKAPHTAAKLRGVVGDRATIYEGDSSEIIPQLLTGGNHTFLHIDPNHIDDMPDLGRIMAAMGSNTGLMITLGCNVSGLKRKAWSERRGWYDYVNTALGYTDLRTHQVFLAWLLGDDSQWAYLIVHPRGYRTNWSAATAGMIKAASKNSEWSGDYVYFDPRGPERFQRQLNILFMTKAERKDANFDY